MPNAPAHCWYSTDNKSGGETFLETEILGFRLEPSAKSKKAVSGKSGGLKGGASRAAKLTPEQRAEIARVALRRRGGKIDLANVIELGQFLKVDVESGHIML